MKRSKTRLKCSLATWSLKSTVLYRVTHLLANLGWVDLNFECSIACPIVPGLMGLSSWARWWNIPNHSQPQPRFARRCVALYTPSLASERLLGFYSRLSSTISDVCNHVIYGSCHILSTSTEKSSFAPSGKNYNTCVLLLAVPRFLLKLDFSKRERRSFRWKRSTPGSCPSNMAPYVYVISHSRNIRYFSYFT